VEDNTHTKEKHKEEVISVSRLNSFSDGVFAVAITLLILNIDVPEMARNLAVHQLPGTLTSMEPKFWAFASSFILIGMFWMVHHSIFHLIKRHSQALAWLNLFLLLSVVALPFSTDLLAIYHYMQLSTIIYAINLGIVGLMIAIIWRYAYRNHKLIDKSLSQGLIWHIQLKSLTTPFVAVIVIFVSFINLSIANWFWLLILVIHFYLESIDRRRYKKERGY
jgi:uncharacterized membrane protein